MERTTTRLFLGVICFLLSWTVLIGTEDGGLHSGAPGGGGQQPPAASGFSLPGPPPRSPPGVPAARARQRRSSLPGRPPAGQFYYCGRTINATRGFIHTPGFPKPFPVPILCRWVLRAPPGKKIVLYFTQFYMRQSFRLTEYDSYTDENTYTGRSELGAVSFEDQVTSFSVYRPCLVLEFQVFSPKSLRAFNGLSAAMIQERSVLEFWQVVSKSLMKLSKHTRKRCFPRTGPYCRPRLIRPRLVRRPA